MSKGPLTYKASDFGRAIKELAEQGISVASYNIQINRNGITLIPTNGENIPTPGGFKGADDWDAAVQ